MDETGDRGFEPEVMILACRRAMAGELEPSRESLDGDGFRARIFVLPCTSEVQVPWLMRVLEGGWDAVLVAGCPEDGCRFLTGSRMAAKRVERVAGLLDRIDVGGERVSMSRRAELTREDLLELASARADAVRPLGPNPMKGERER